MSSSQMANTTQLFVRSNIHMANLDMALKRHLHVQKFVDVTLSCEGRKFKCHRLILAAASPLLERLFLDNPTPHPIVIMPLDIKAWTLQALIEFMYTGHVRVSKCGLGDLVRSAETLQITGLENARKDFGINCSSAAGSSVSATTKPVHGGKARRRNVSTCGNSDSQAAADAVACTNGDVNADLEDMDSTTNVLADDATDLKANGCQSYGRAHDARGHSRDVSDEDNDDLVVRPQAVGKIRVKSSEILLEARSAADQNTGRDMHRKLTNAISLRRLKIPRNNEIIIRENQEQPQSHGHKTALRRQRPRPVLSSERPYGETQLRPPLSAELQVDVERASEAGGQKQLTPPQQTEATDSDNTAVRQLTTSPLDIVHITELDGTRTPTPTSMPAFLAVENIVCQPNMSYMYNGGSSGCSSPDFQAADNAAGAHDAATGEVDAVATTASLTNGGDLKTAADYTKNEQPTVVGHSVDPANVYRFPSYAANADACVATAEVAIAQVELHDKWPTALRCRPMRYNNYAQPEQQQRAKAYHKLWPVESLLYANNGHMSATVTAKYNKLLRLAKVAHSNSSSHQPALSRGASNTMDPILSNNNHADADYDAAIGDKVSTFTPPPPASANGIDALAEAAATVGLEPSVETVVLRSPRTNQPRNYSTQALYNALMAVKHGESIYRASREYHVPRKTLRNWMKRWNIKSQYPMPKQLKDAAIRKKTTIDITTHATLN